MVILVQYLFGGGCVDDVYQSVGVSGKVEWREGYQYMYNWPYSVYMAMSATSCLLAR